MDRKGMKEWREVDGDTQRSLTESLDSTASPILGFRSSLLILLLVFTNNVPFVSSTDLRHRYPRQTNFVFCVLFKGLLYRTRFLLAMNRSSIETNRKKWYQILGLKFKYIVPISSLNLIDPKQKLRNSTKRHRAISYPIH